LLLPIGLMAMLWMSWQRLARAWGGLSFAQKIQAALWVPIIRVTGDFAKMIGWPVGVWWRWWHRAQIPNWRQQ
jgi:hypothetical protein